MAGGGTQHLLQVAAVLAAAVGLVVPNAYEMVPVLNSPDFKPSSNIPILDVQGILNQPIQLAC
jgi:hypothetical protein